MVFDKIIKNQTDLLAEISYNMSMIQNSYDAFLWSWPKGSPLFLSMLWLHFSLSFAQENKNLQRLIEDAETTKQSFIASEPTMADLFEDTYGHAIFPNLGKGAFILGFSAGRGLVWQNHELIGEAKLRETSLGLQIGGQAFQLVIFYDNDEAFSRLKANKLEFRAQAAALVDNKSASTKLAMAEGIKVFAIPKKGIMAEVAIGGQKFKFRRFNTSEKKTIKQKKEISVEDYFDY